MSRSHPHFVADNTAGSRTETATLLVGTAREFGIHQRSIKAAQGGFWITEALADVIYDESEPEPEPEVSGNKATTKTSGNRAAKNQPTEKE